MATGSLAFVEIAPGITFFHYSAVRDLDLANYSDQIDVMTKIAKRAFAEKTTAHYLCFGMAGTGKTSLARKSNWNLNSYHKMACSRIEIKCNTLVFNASTAETAKHFLSKAIFYMKKYRPMLVFFDELDALARTRVRTDPRITEFSHLVCSMLDEKFAKSIKEQGQLVVVGITNDPEGVDDAVRDRLGSTIYVPLPTVAVIREILQKQVIPRFEMVADRMTEHLGNDRISPRGLVEGCADVKKNSSDLLQGTNPDPDKIAREILGASGGRKSERAIEEYGRRNETYIKQSDLVMARWRKL